MDILESVLLGEFISYIKSNWSAHSRVVSKVRAVIDAAAEAGAVAAVRDESISVWVQVLRSEAQRGHEVLDATGQAAAVASSARRFLAGFKALLVCSDEVTAAIDMLERLDKDLNMFVRVLSLAASTEEDMDVDESPAPGARHRQEGSAGSASAALLPSPGAKRRRDGDGGGGSTSRGEVDTARPQKRRILAWTRSRQGFPSGSGRVSSAHPEPTPRSRRARTAALAMSRIRRRIGKPTTTRHRPQPSLGQHFSRITL